MSQIFPDDQIYVLPAADENQQRKMGEFDYKIVQELFEKEMSEIEKHFINFRSKTKALAIYPYLDVPFQAFAREVGLIKQIIENSNDKMSHDDILNNSVGIYAFGELELRTQIIAAFLHKYLK